MIVTEEPRHEGVDASDTSEDRLVPGEHRKKSRKHKTLCETTVNVVLVGGSTTNKSPLAEAAQEASTRLYGDQVYDMSTCAAAVYLDGMNKKFTRTFAVQVSQEVSPVYANVLDVPDDLCTAECFEKFCDDPYGLSKDAQLVYSNMALGDVFVVCYSMEDPGSLLMADRLLRLISVLRGWDPDNEKISAVLCMTKWDRRTQVPHSSQNELLRQGEATARRWNVPHVTSRIPPDPENADAWAKVAIERALEVRRNENWGCCDNCFGCLIM